MDPRIRSCRRSFVVHPSHDVRDEPEPLLTSPNRSWLD